jgi:phage protein D
MADPALDKPRNSPSFKLFVRGRELPVETALDVLDLRVSDYVEGAGTFTIRFNVWHSDKQEFKLLDDSTLSEGTEVEVKIGFVDNLKSMMKGEVTALEPEFSDTESPTLKVHGYDLLHRFRRGRKTRSFTNMKDSQIAEQIAGELNLSGQADDTEIAHEYVLQANQTDVDFLLERARRINYEVIVKDKTLLFRKAANNTGKVITLQYGLTLKSFYPRLSTLRQVSEVVVQGWNPKKKEAISGRARAGDENSKMSGSKLGSAISESAFFKTQSFIVDKPIFSEGEAAQIAKGKFNELAVEFITGEAVGIGNTDVRAGVVVELKGLGKRFSGLYYVTSSTHVIDQSGYTTRFMLERNST